MPSSTCIKLVTFCDEDALGVIDAMKAGTDDVTFMEDHDDTYSGLTAYSSSGHCLSSDRTKALIEAFQHYAFNDPKYAVLVINDDKIDENDGVYVPL
tara:strand:- start:177010 stop:177300 length:291 start_codon:yes stop_codon:yes gene_type:complete